MLVLIFLASLAAAAPAPAPRSKSIENLRAACEKSDVHEKADKRRAICDCLAKKINANTSITDADFDYVVRTWNDPGKKITDAPEHADILQEFDSDSTNACIKSKG